jgi:hypothetical protein
MRLWSLHPKYLDARGLVALWREGLLARKVLRGLTKGYRNHPQLERFRTSSTPLPAVESYLCAVLNESQRRGYVFDESKIIRPAESCTLSVTHGQLIFEAVHLCRKLERRDIAAFHRLRTIRVPEPHPLFEVIEGPVEQWERGKEWIHREMPAAKTIVRRST